MAATLPAINMTNRTGAGQVSTASFQLKPAPPHQPPQQQLARMNRNVGNTKQVVVIKRQNLADRRLEERKQMLRGQLEELGPWQTSQ